MEDDKVIEERDLDNTPSPDVGESGATPDSEPAPIASSSPAPDDVGDEPVATAVPVPVETPVAVPTHAPANEPTEEPMLLPTEEPATEPEEDTGLDPTEEPEENEESSVEDLDPTEEPSLEPEEGSDEGSYMELPNGWTYIDGFFYDEDGNVVDMATFSSNDEESIEYTEIYTDEEAFKESTVQVNLYEYMILERLDIMTYGMCIVIGLLFINLFIRKRK